MRILCEGSQKMIKNIKNINVEYPDVMADREVEIYVDDAIATSKVALARIEIMLVGGEVEIKSFERSPITRIRRVTGYLSKVSNFNDSKRAELESRVKHFEA